MGEYPFKDFSHPKLVKEEENLRNKKTIVSLPFYVFLSFDSFNHFFTYVLVRCS